MNTPIGAVRNPREEELIARATEAWNRICRRNGWQPQQPCRHSCAFDPRLSRVVLRNVNGELASFDFIPTTNRLRYIEPQA